MKDYKIYRGSLLILPPVDKTGRDIRVSIGYSTFSKLFRPFQTLHMVFFAQF